MANEIIKVFDTEAAAITNHDTDGRINPIAAITNHAGIITNVAAEDIPYYIYKKFYYRFEANEPVTEFHIDWDDGEDNSPEKANIEIIKLDTPDTVAITSHIYTEHKYFFPLIRVKSIDGYLSKWYTNDGKQTDGSGTPRNDFSSLERNTVTQGQNEFSTVSLEKTNTDRINSFLPANLPPIGVLKVDKKRIYSGIDNDVILSSYNWPLLYAYSTSTTSTKPDIKFTLQDSKGAVKEHTLAAANIWNASGTWTAIGSSSNTANSIPSGNYYTGGTNEKWRLTALNLLDDGTHTEDVEKISWTTLSDMWIDIWYDNGSKGDVPGGPGNPYTDKANMAGVRIFFSDGSTTGPIAHQKEPNGINTINEPNMSTFNVEIPGDGSSGGSFTTETLMNTIKGAIDAHNSDDLSSDIMMPLTTGTVTSDGSGGHFLDITREVSGATYDWSIYGISSTHMTLTKQTDGAGTIFTTESAKKLLRVELDNATELADNNKVYIKVFDSDEAGNTPVTPSTLASVTENNTLAVLTNGNPIVEIEDANTIYLDGTESFTRASNLSIIRYNFDDDKLNNVGAVQATDDDAVSDLMSGTMISTGTKELSYSFNNNGDSLDSDGRFYPTYRLTRLQVKDNMSTLANGSTAKNSLKYSAIEHFDDASYTAANVEIPSDLESKGLLLYSNKDATTGAMWRDVSTRNINDTQEIMGNTSATATGSTYRFNDSTNITDHPKNHLFIAQTEKFDRLFFRMNNNNEVGDTMPEVSITAYYANGNTWTPLEIIDETQGLKTSGSIKFNMPHDWYKGKYTHIDSGSWDGPVDEQGDSSAAAPGDLWSFNAYGILISFTVKASSNNHRKLKCMNVWPYNNSHSQLIKLEDPHYISLNSIAIAQSISFGRTSKVISVEDKFGKADIRKIGASGGSVKFGGIDLGNNDDDRKTIVGYQKNATPVFLDVEHKSGEKTRFFGIISQVTEDHPAGKMIPKWAVSMNISHVLELSSTGAVNSDKISIGGALVDDGKYLL